MSTDTAGEGTAELAEVEACEVAAAQRRADKLSLLCVGVESELRGCGAELKWLLAHPLWLPVPLAPLCKALRWDAAAVRLLLLFRFLEKPKNPSSQKQSNTAQTHPVKATPVAAGAPGSVVQGTKMGCGSGEAPTTT